MTDPAVLGLSRHFVTIGGRQIHYRRTGHGPPLVMLHRLPRSSKDLVSRMLATAGRFCVIAPDLAGYGNSWPLPDPQPNITRYAADVGAFIDALGIRRCLLYAEGAGATVALALAAAAPWRFAAAALNGIEIHDAADIASAKESLRPFIPTEDGRHFAWLWARLREENAFAPPWRKTLAARIDGAMPSPAELQARAVQFVSGVGHGSHYDLGIRAAIDADACALSMSLPIPVLFTGARSHHDDGALSRLPQNPLATIATEDSVAAAFDGAIAFLAVHAGQIGPPPVPPAVQPVPGRLWSDFADVPGGQLHFHMNGDASSVPLLVQHDAASSVGTVAPITGSFVGRRTVMAFDMPGSGESDCTLGDTVDVQAYADTLAAALDDLGLEKVDFYGMWGGGFVGLDLALSQPHRIRRLVMSNVFQHDGEEQRSIQANYTPDVSPHWHGGHLLQCWHQMRDQGIYYPWFDATRRGVIRREPFLATDMVHERVCSLVKAGNAYRTAYQAHFRYRTYERLQRSPVPTMIATSAWDPNNEHTQAAARAAPNAQFRLLDDDFTKWGPSFLDFLEN